MEKISGPTATLQLSSLANYISCKYTLRQTSTVILKYFVIFPKYVFIQHKLADFDLNKEINKQIRHGKTYLIPVLGQNRLKSNYNLIIFDYLTPFNIFADANNIV